MKKLLMVMMCVGLLSACAKENTPIEPQKSAEPQVTQKPGASGVKTMISASDKSPISDSWTTLGEAMLPVGDDLADVYLATTAVRGSDGYMQWDDSQEWAVTVELEDEVFVLMDEHLHGKVYIDVTTRNKQPVVSVIHTSTIGMNVTEYVYENGSFYADALITADGSGNNIYNSIPDYYED